jgi:outer membrane protein assembly factor BamB
MQSRDFRSRVPLSILSLLTLFCVVPGASAADWTMWGGDASRNMVSAEKGIPSDFTPGDYVAGTEQVNPATTKNVKWVAKLGSQTYGNPVIADGRVYVGTNNENPRDPALTGDRAVLLCLDEKTGEMIWQLNIPKLGAGKVSDWEFLGICSSPAVDGDRVYIVSNRCEVVCLDARGMANGNDGPFMYERLYTDDTYWSKKEQGSLPPAGDPSLATPDHYADILWVYDMRDELGVFPHNITSNGALVVGDAVYVATSNGVDWSHTNIPNPNAPALIGLNKMTGELLGEDGSPICKNLLHCNWSSPAFATIDGKEQLIFAGGDGFIYGFDPKPVKDEEGFDIYPELWRFDGNPKTYRVDEEGKSRKYATYHGPSEYIATPVIVDSKIYIAVGQDPEHGDGLGSLRSIDPSRTGETGDISESGKIWANDEIHRTISTAAVHDGLLYVPDYRGMFYCVDAATGETVWTHDTQANIWGSPLVVDGKVYQGTEDGVLYVFEAGRTMKLVASIQFPTPIYSTPVVANGVLYVGTQTHLYAIAGNAN